ncbi:hypothetical protein B0H16DRAFT_1703640 [Mycena metata]|uniref:Uncharacterized protein n=1 Tax=Mycena metata TaxID=1033252 RepID=A0AAD7H3L5_9AGAR|nr:hypothetical protein B0H16DRAFT_1703640 [Mycena metata]
MALMATVHSYCPTPLYNACSARRRLRWQIVLQQSKLARVLDEAMKVLVWLPLSAVTAVLSHPHLRLRLYMPPACRAMYNATILFPALAHTPLFNKLFSLCLPEYLHIQAFYGEREDPDKGNGLRGVDEGAHRTRSSESSCKRVRESMIPAPTVNIETHAALAHNAIPTCVVCWSPDAHSLTARLAVMMHPWLTKEVSAHALHNLHEYFALCTIFKELQDIHTPRSLATRLRKSQRSCGSN